MINQENTISSEMLHRLSMPGFAAPMTQPMNDLLDQSVVMERGGKIMMLAAGRIGIKPLIMDLTNRGTDLIGGMTIRDLMGGKTSRMGLMIPGRQTVDRILETGDLLCNQMERNWKIDWASRIRAFAQVYDEAVRSDGRMVFFTGGEGQTDYLASWGIKPTRVGSLALEWAVRALGYEFGMKVRTLAELPIGRG